MKRKLSWRIRERFFKIIRPLFVRDIDRNEDFNCCKCNKPVLRRFLFCSIECAEEFDRECGV